MGAEMQIFHELHIALNARANGCLVFERWIIIGCCAVFVEQLLDGECRIVGVIVVGIPIEVQSSFHFDEGKSEAKDTPMCCTHVLKKLVDDHILTFQRIDIAGSK